MEEREAKRINKKLMVAIKKAKLKYKGKSPKLTFIIKNNGSHETVGFINEKDGKFEVTQCKYGLLDEWIRGKFDFSMSVLFDKNVQAMEDFTSIIQNSVK